MTYYAVCNVNGPISVNLEVETKEEALDAFAEGAHREWVDSPRTDAEDELDIYGAGMSEGDFADAMETAGFIAVCDLDEHVNAYSGKQSHVKDGWMLWSESE